MGGVCGARAGVQGGREEGVPAGSAHRPPPPPPFGIQLPRLLPPFLQKTSSRFWKPPGGWSWAQQAQMVRELLGQHKET